jgi:signal transduction histidine kinase
LQQVRSLSLVLRPSVLDDLGLVPALRWLLDRQAAAGGFTAEFVADPEQVDVPVDVRTACYRIAQESLTNILRYAKARNVSVRLQQNDDGLFLSVADDGVGFSVPEARMKTGTGRSLGVLGMEERATLTGGHFAIHSASGNGTTVRVHFPEYRRNAS